MPILTGGNCGIAVTRRWSSTKSRRKRWGRAPLLLISAPAERSQSRSAKSWPGATACSPPPPPAETARSPRGLRRKIQTHSRCPAGSSQLTFKPTGANHSHLRANRLVISDR
jgi:hypothetical protein